VIHDLLLRLAINRMTGLKPYEKLQLEDIVDSEHFFRSLNAPILSRIVGRTVTVDESPDELLRVAESDCIYLRDHDIHVVPYRSSHYPAALKEIYDPPYLLYVRGEIPLSDRPMIAIVGTREPTAEAMIAAIDLAQELSEDGFWVISGLARGIDAAAHRGALTGGGRTGAVLGSGIDAITPVGNREIGRRILDAGGFVCSEYAPGVRAAKHHFPARNRIISGLCRGVVIIQAPQRSGALITADYALDHGRDLFVHSAGTQPPVGEGSAELAADGALIISAAQDIYTEWGVEPSVRRATKASRKDRSSDARTCRDAGLHLAESLAASLGLSLQESNRR
jgi:DNA processing protein